MSSTSRRICVIGCRCPRAQPPAGKRDVDPLLGETPVEIGACQLILPRVERGLELLADRVQRHPGLPVADVPERLLERALTAEVLDASLLDRVQRRRRGCSTEGLGFERLRVHGARGYQRPFAQVTVCYLAADAASRSPLESPLWIPTPASPPSTTRGRRT